MSDNDPAANLESAKNLYARDIREAITLGGRRYAAIARGGEAAIRDVIARSDDHFKQTGNGVPIRELLDSAERDMRHGLREAALMLRDAPEFNTPEARTARARSAIHQTLARARSAEEHSGDARGLHRSAVRRETEAERRSRAKAAVEAVWRRNEDR